MQSEHIKIYAFLMPIFHRLSKYICPADALEGRKVCLSIYTYSYFHAIIQVLILQNKISLQQYSIVVNMYNFVRCYNSRRVPSLRIDLLLRHPGFILRK